MEEYLPNTPLAFGGVSNGAEAHCQTAFATHKVISNKYVPLNNRHLFFKYRHEFSSNMKLNIAMEVGKICRIPGFQLFTHAQYANPDINVTWPLLASHVDGKMKFTLRLCAFCQWSCLQCKTMFYMSIYTGRWR